MKLPFGLSWNYDNNDPAKFIVDWADNSHIKEYIEANMDNPEQYWAHGETEGLPEPNIEQLNSTLPIEPVITPEVVVEEEEEVVENKPSYILSADDATDDPVNKVKVQNFDIQPHHSFFYLLSGADTPFGTEERKDFFNNPILVTDFNIEPTPFRTSNLSSNEIMNPTTDPRLAIVDTPDEFKSSEYEFEQDKMWDYNYVPTIEQFWEYIKGHTNKLSPAINWAFQSSSFPWGHTELGYWRQKVMNQSLHHELKNISKDKYIEWTILGEPQYEFVNGKMVYTAPSYIHDATNEGSKKANGKGVVYFLNGLLDIGEKTYQKHGHPAFKNYYAMMYAIDNPQYMDMLLLSHPNLLKDAGINVEYADNRDFTLTYFSDIEQMGYENYLSKPVSYELVNDEAGDIYLLRSNK